MNLNYTINSSKFYLERAQPHATGLSNDERNLTIIAHRAENNNN